MPSPQLLHRIYHGEIQARLDFGRSLHAVLSSPLSRDEIFTAAFATLRRTAETLSRQMVSAGMGRQCVACSANNPGGCCSREMAGETDAVQILMNLLAGVEVKVVEQPGEVCRYLGEQGCIFAFKPMFCLNYNCDRIISRLGPARPELERSTGRLLGHQYEVERILLARIEALAGPHNR